MSPKVLVDGAFICYVLRLIVSKRPIKEIVHPSLSSDKVTKTKRFRVQYPITAYTFPSDARIHRVRIDDDYIHIELLDGRILSIPLWWVPTVYNAEPEEREKFNISRDRTMIIWDPETCAINDELRVADYLKCGA